MVSSLLVLLLPPLGEGWDGGSRGKDSLTG
jgi:hypothetical protein